MPSRQFLKLSKERQGEILDACLREFAEHGYDLASTNRITRNLGISKGVLFKYFGDKAGLFLFVCERGMREYEDAVVVRPCGDMFDCIADLGMQKLRWLHERPLTYRLVMRIIKEPHHPMHAQVLQQASAVSRKYAKVLQSVPITGLRNGVTPEQVLSAIGWVAQGLEDRYANTLPENVEAGFDSYYQGFSKEMNVYFDIIKHGIHGAALS
jgi:TetR/AcrR family transcriptional regulator